MDFIDEIKVFSSKVQKLKDVIATEEATKTSLILPFFQMLGYDVFNPLEFVPEFTADVGIKKGEKVDYAVFIDEKPVILIEAKWCGEKLDNHDSQLFRYFATTSAKFGILTNGLVYRFYTDLDEVNKMDLTPFMEIDLLNIKESLVPDLKRFHRSSFDLESIFSAASDLKYSSLVKQYFSKQLASPDDDFVKLIVGEVYQGRKTQQTIDKFREIIKKSLSQYITEVMQERFKSVIDTTKKDETSSSETNPVIIEEKTVKSAIITTDEERDAFALIKILLSDTIESTRLFINDTVNYCSIVIDEKPRKWICLLRLGLERKSIEINTELKSDRIEITSIDDIMGYKQQLIEAARRLI